MGGELATTVTLTFSSHSSQSEQELRVAQTEFDRQAEVTRLLLEGISSTHVSVPTSSIIHCLVTRMSPLNVSEAGGRVVLGRVV